MLVAGRHDDGELWSGDGRTIFYLGTDLATIHAVHVNPGPPFTVGSSEVVATIPQLGEAWDVDRRSGRMVLTQAVGRRVRGSSCS